MWTTPSKKPLSHHNDALHHNQIEPKTTMVMVFHQNHVARSFIKKSAPRPRILRFTPVGYRQVRNLGRQGLGGWESASEKNRKDCVVKSRGRERKAGQNGCNRTNGCASGSVKMFLQKRRRHSWDVDPARVAAGPRYNDGPLGS